MKYLEEVRRVVRNIPDDNFDIDFLISKCGTVGCVLGHLGLDPYFRERGIVSHPEWNDVILRDEGVYTEVAEFFDLSFIDAQHLFGFNSDFIRKVRPRHVLANLDRIEQGLPALNYNDLVIA